MKLSKERIENFNELFSKIPKIKFNFGEEFEDYSEDEIKEMLKDENILDYVISYEVFLEKNGWLYSLLYIPTNIPEKQSKFYISGTRFCKFDAAHDASYIFDEQENMWISLRTDRCWTICRGECEEKQRRD